MNDTQLILTALSQVPDLVEAARTYKEVNDKAVIKDREFQSHFKKGKFKTEPKVGFGD